MSSRGDIAIEIELSPGHELENIEKDLEAGFSQVVCLVTQSGRVEKIQAECARHLPSEWKQLVRVDLVQNYAQILEDLLV
jgi:hypothetical protein